MSFVDCWCGFVVYHIPRKEYPITLADKALLDSFTVVVESTGHAHSRSVELFYFDPNTVDSVDMLRLGFTDWQIRNNMKYRRLGGVGVQHPIFAFVWVKY